MKEFKKFVAFVLLFCFLGLNSSVLTVFAVDGETETAPEIVITPVVEEETFPIVENLVIDQQPSVAVSKINICHKNGESWMFMDTPAGPSLDGHIGHGDFLYDNSWGEGNDQKCSEHSPVVIDLCPNMEGTQTNSNDCPQPQEAQISAAKIICASETDLPNWGSGGPNITAATAPDFLVTHPNCYEQSGWKYEWAVDGTANPGDNVEVGGGAWTVFDENNLPEVPVGSRVWVREQIPNGYLPFSSDTDGENGWSDVSAEFYCSTDVLNYDNYDWIDVTQPNIEYHCIAFNVQVEEPLQCNPQVNLFENGNFEAPALGLNTWGIIPDSNPLLKWLVSWTSPQTSGTLGLEIQNNVAGTPLEGSQHAELDGDHPVTISQTIPTIIGKTYDLSFAYSARPGRDTADNTIEVKAGGNVLGAILSDDGTSLINTLWGTQTRSFVATSTSTTIEFKDTGSDTSFGGYLDNVDLRCNPEQKDDGFIHIYKFVDGVQATAESVNGVSFPMFNNRDVNTYTLNPNGWWGGNDQSPADIPYEATAWQAGGGTYSTWENLTTELVGASCEEGKPYALEGYSSGTTLESAIAGGANKTLETPSFVIDGDVNVIVWNKKCVDQEPDPKGSIQITKYVCPANTTVVRSANGVGGAVPEGCVLQSGKTFGYVHGSQTDANGPYPELSAPLTAGGTTASGILTISNLPATGRYLIVETDSNNVKMADGDILGLYCQGDGDQSNNNDNQELTFVPNNGTAYCIAYNKAGEVQGETATSHTTVVKAADLAADILAVIATPTKWFFYNDETDVIDNALGSFVTGPASAPVGTGSAQMSVTGTQRRNIATYQFKDVKLADIKTLSFSTYSQLAGDGAFGLSERAPYLHFNVDFNNTDTWQSRLVYVPATNGVVVSDTWQTWDAINSGNALWVYSGATWPTTVEAGTTPKTWAQILALYPNAETRSTDSWFGFRVGEPYADGFTGNVDKFMMGIKTGLNTHTETYDFEPTLVEIDTTECSDDSDNDADGLNNQADPGCHSDGNVNNPNSYVPSDDNESNESSICSDGKDNDSDGLIDSNDPGCHDNNNLADPWNPSDSDETNNIPTTNSGGGGGNSSGSKPAGQGLVLGAETSCGIYVDKFLRRGYKNDVEAVKKVQTFLNNYMKAGLPVTGYFGIQTEKALKKFQTAYPETVLGPWGFKKPTGIFYLTTQTQVNNIMCPELKLPIPALTPIETNPLAPKKA